MRVEKEEAAGDASGLRGWLGRLGTGDRIKLLIVVIGLCTALGFSLNHWTRIREVKHGEPMQAPPEALALREANRSPMAPNLTREERIARFKEQGQRIWEQSTREQKMVVVGGFFNEWAAHLKLKPEQAAPARAVYDSAMNGMLDIWEGWWNKDFNRPGAMLRTLAVAGQARVKLATFLDPAQLEAYDKMLVPLNEAAANPQPGGR